MRPGKAHCNGPPGPRSPGRWPALGLQMASSPTTTSPGQGSMGAGLVTLRPAIQDDAETLSNHVA